MKRSNTVFALVMLVLASLACQAVTGDGGSGEAPQIQPLPSVEETESIQQIPTEEEAQEYPEYSFGSDTEFPLPDDAQNVTEVAGTVNYQTKLSLDDVMKFYRDAFASLGYTERELLTTVSDGVFSIVFDGHESGQAIVIQGVDLGDGSMNVNIRLEDV